MNVSLNWLTEYVDITLPVAELGEVLTHSGLYLEELIDADTDLVLDLEVTSNRPDWLGHLGVAREIAAITGAKFTPPAIGKLPTTGKVKNFTSVQVDEPQLCPRYTARVIRNVKVAPSPAWMVERLQAVGLRSINNIVDVTNYVMMEYSQPLHSFDYDKLAEGRIVVRRARKGETLVSIDETKCELTEDMLVIADARRPVAIAGVMGGLDTEVTEGTVNVLLEAAQFDPLNIRSTSRKLQLMSDSNYRFERGIDPVRLEEASLRACQLILEIAGGELAEGVVDIWAAPWQPRKISMRPQRCDKLLGTVTPVERQMEILKALGLQPALEDGKIVCIAPSHRADLTREVDLIEEVARIEGFDKIPVGKKIAHEVMPVGQPQRVRQIIGQTLTAAGFDETISSTFVDVEEAHIMGYPHPMTVDANVRKTNNAIRPTLISSLLRACKTNQDAGSRDVSLFEIASVFPADQGDLLPKERTEIGLATTGSLQQLRGALDAVMQRVAWQAKLEVRMENLPGFGEGAAATLLIDGEPVGVMGMADVNVLDYYGLNADKPIAAAAVKFDALLKLAGQTRMYQPVPRFPAVDRDLSLILDEQVTWQHICEAVARVPQPLRVGMNYVTTYRGKQIQKDKKSVTLSVTYRSDEATLRSEEVDQQINELISAMKKDFSAELRA